ncbi:advillin-like isoform X2 [Physella acuta]|nr:advillin-like isoform X2 [Physella acuta]XP_059161732.1 advillin-like isoform X2 [Physella acuta]
MGFFHQANIYIISKRDTDGATFLHIWHGSLSSKKESTIAREKAGILDLSMDGATFVSLEHEGNETATFLSHFPDGIVIVEGKSKQSLERSTKYAKKLYLVTGRSQPLATCVDCSVSLATPNHVLILDSHPRIYVWVGEHVDYVLKVKAIKLAKKIRDFQRNGKCHIIIIDKSVSELANLFIKKLETFQQSEPSLRTKISENFPESTPQLYRVNGDRVLYDMPLVVTRPLQQKYLTSKDSFILETKPTEPLFIWVGSKSDPDATSEALKCAEAFVSYHNTSPKRAVCRVTEGDEPTSFKKYFSDWKDRLVKKSRVVHHYNISNIERSLFSKNNNHSNGKVTEVSMKDYDLLDGNGDLQIWKVNDEYLVLLPIEQQWVFDNWSCYIILYSESRGGRDISIIFYWVGAKTNREEEVQAQKSALAMDQALGHKNVIVRILDGKETSHFMTALQNNIIVYDVDQQLRENAANYCSNNVTKMYSVKEVTKHSTRISQVPPVSSSLNTNAAFIITSPEVSFLWYGKNASAYEREYSKSMLAYFSPGKTYDYDIFLEGKETAKVWSAVEIDEQPSMDMEKHSLPSCQPKLVLCKKHLGKWKFDYLDNFTQEDLCENVQFILDLQNEVLLWTGISVPDRNHELLSGILNEFVDSDPAGRNMSDLQVWYVNQGYEPQVFKKHFQIWEETNYGGELAYEIARKRLRQENALIDCEVNNKELDHYVKIPYKNLITKDKLPDSIDRNHLELYLSDKDFMQILNMPRTEFYRMPAWKQKQILKSAKLFVSASKTQDNYLTSHNEVKAA